MNIIKLHKVLNGFIAMVKAPDNSCDFQVVNNGSKFLNDLHYNYIDIVDGGFIALPVGNWELIGLLNEVTEEQASKIVDKSFNTPLMYKDYVNNLPGLKAIESLFTLADKLECWEKSEENTSKWLVLFSKV